MYDDWNVQESGNIDFGDKRLNKRYDKILHDVCKQISLSIPQALPHYSDCEAVYRFVNNNKVNYCELLAEHGYQTLNRMQDLSSVDTILAVQDT
ncbi:MAG TPA: transposase DNA-binding-containing protein, partial [Candidatus Cloacimonadota bacterium]|nr:transposase DNA-binding-containing protein [Candidatus Cloacimonadota bacterium]